MARDLTQSEESFEHVDGRATDAVSTHAREKRRLVVPANGLVRRALRRGHHAVNGLLDPRR